MRCFLALLLLCGAEIFAQPGQNLPANELVRQVVYNEQQAMKQDHSLWMYQAESQKGGVKEVSETVETRQVDLTRLIAKNGQLLNDQQRKQEEQRIEKFVNSPDEQRKKKQSEEADARKTEQLFAMLPDAFSFSYAERNGDTVKLNFQPNPSFRPPTREAHAFQEMEGQMIVDEREKRLMEIHGHLKKAVHFGIFGYLDQGGTFDVKQEEVAPTHWEITLLKVNMKGKALFFKTISVQQDEMRSHFRQVPETTTLSQARDMLEKQATQPLTP